jgi:threonine dehydrogenase-like Zn-dependent dehydrogenase
VKAFALMGPRVLEVIAVPDAREPGPGEALVRVTAGARLEPRGVTRHAVDLAASRIADAVARAFRALADYHEDAAKVVISPA